MGRPCCSVSKLGELGVEGGDSLVLGSVLASLDLLLLGVVEDFGLDLSLGFKFADDTGLGPSSDGGEITERAVVSACLQAEGSQSVGNDHSLLLVVGEGDTFEDLQLTESVGASGELVGEHTTGALPEDARGSLPMHETTAGVGVDALLHNVLADDMVSLERARLENLLASHNSDALATEKFLSNNASETALQVTSSIND